MGSKGMRRRDVLQLAAVAIGASVTASQAMAAPCAPADGPDASLRMSLHYTESSQNPAQKCSGCSFFSEPQGTCGKCQIFNGPTNQNGHCDSWAAKS